jgi:hypothetical protein
MGQAVQKWSDARRAKTEERGVYQNTPSDEVCSATQQMSVFQQPVNRPGIASVDPVLATGEATQRNSLCKSA